MRKKIIDLWSKQGRLLFALFLVLFLFILTVISSGRSFATTGINQEVNFQGRLLNSEGATVPDGYYNIEFKIYANGNGQNTGDSGGSPAGTLLWSEDYLNDNSQGVQVVNGFLSVQLGSICAFSGGSCQGNTNLGVNWNETPLWLSMNIAGTNTTCTPFSSCSPDGEMLPMKELSSDPYALNSNLLGGLNSSQFVQLAQGEQTDSSTASSIYINKTGGSGNLLQLLSSGIDAFLILNNGSLTFGNNANHTISTETAGSGSAGNSITITSGAAGTGGSALAGGNLTLQGGGGGGTNGYGGDVSIDGGQANGSGNNGTVSIGTNYASGVTIGNSSALTTIQGNLSVPAANALLLGAANSHTGGIAFYGSGGSGTLTLVGPTTPNTGDYTLTAPTITANDILATLGLGQTFSGADTFSASGTGLTVSNNATISGTTTTSTVNATSIIELNGVNINNAGTLSEVAYLDQTQTFADANTFSASGTALTVSNNASINGTGTIGTLSVTSNGTVGGTLGVTGLLTASGGLTVATGQNLTLNSGTGTYTQTYVSTATGGSQSAATINTTNSNSSATVTTVNADNIALVGTTNSNGNDDITNAINFANITSQTGNTFNGLYFGTGYASLLNYNGTSLINGSGILQNGAIGTSTNYSNLNEVGALSSGSIASGFGIISTGNNITTTANVQAAVVNATSTLELNGVSINTAGTLTNVAYLNQTQTFADANTFSASGTALTVSNNASINGTGTIGTLSVTSNGTVGGTLGVTGLLTASGGLTVATGQNLTLNSGTGTYTQTYVSTATGGSQSAATINTTNSNSSATVTTVNADNIALVGTTNSNGNDDITNAINFANITSQTGNTFNGLYFGTGYASLLNYNGTSLINGSGILQNGAIGTSTNYSNLNEVGALSSGSIASGFGGINDGSNEIQTTGTILGGTVQGSTVNATSIIELNGVNINNAGTLSEVAYLDQTQTFADANTFSASGTALTVSNNASINGTGTIGTLSVTSNGTVGGTLGVTGLLTASGGLTVATGQNLTLNSGTGTYTQTYVSTATGGSQSAATINTTNSNSSATVTTVNADNIALVGTTNSNGNDDITNAINFANITSQTGNTFNGLYFGTGYASLLNYNGTSLINGSGILQNGAIGTSTNYSNLNEVGALSSGSIASGFGIISTGNNITTTANVQAAVVNATSTLELNGVSINTAGTLTNVAYLNQTQTFADANTFSASGTALTVSNNASINGTGTIGTLSVTSNGTVGGTLGVTGLLTASGGLTVATGQNLTLNSGTGTYTQTYVSTATGGSQSAATINTTNSNSSATVTTVNADNIALVGTTNSNGNDDITNAINFANITSQTGNTFNGLYFGTGYASLLNYNGTSLINGSGILQNGAIGTSTNYSNLNEVGALSSGSIASGFGGINDGSNEIQTTGTILGGTVQGSTVNATSIIELNGVNINNAGTLSEVAYLDQTQTFADANTFSASGTALTVSNNASINGTGTIGTLSVTSNGTVGGTLGVTGLLTASGGLTVATGQNLTLNSGTGTYTQTYVSTATGGSQSAATINTTNSNSSATVTTVNADNIALVGTTNSNGNDDITNAINFANITSQTGNTFNGLYFGTGYASLLNYNGTSLINGSGILQNGAIGTSTNYSNLNEVGALSSGSIASGFGIISTGNNITTTANVQAAVVNATSTLELNGVSINTAGTLTNVAYLNQTQTFADANTFSASGTALTVSNNASINGTGTIGTLSVTSNGTVGGTLGVTGLLTASGGLTVATGQNLTLNSGTGTYTQTYVSTATGGSQSAATINTTNSNSSATVTTVNADNIALVGTTNSNGNDDITNAINFANITSQTGNTFNGLYFGTGYASLLNYNGTSLINGSGILQNGAIGTSTNYSNLNEVGALSSGSIASGFGGINDGSNEIQTTGTILGGTVQGSTVNATSIIELNGVNINNAGTLSEVAYLDQTQTFADANTFSASGTALTVSNNASINGTGTIGTLSVTSNGTVGGTLGVTTLGANSSPNTYLCYNSSKQIAGCSSTANGAAFVQGGNNFGTNAVLGTTGATQTLTVEATTSSEFVLNTSGTLTFQQASTINTTSGNNLSIDTGGANTLNLGETNATTIDIGNNNLAHTIAIGAGGTSTIQGISIGSTFTGSSLALQAAGNISANSTGLQFSANASTLNIASAATGSSLTIQGGASTSGTTVGANLLLQGGAGASTGASGSVIVKSNTNNSATAFVVQNAIGTGILTVDTKSADVASAVTINSGTSGDSGLVLTQIAPSITCTGFCSLLGINNSGQVGTSNAAVSLTSPALAYWDGLNDPTASDQSYPTNPIASYTCSGSCTGAGGTGGFNNGNGELLNPAQQNTYGSLNWNFAQVPFEEVQFQVRTTPCSLNCSGLTSGADASWFYSYAANTNSGGSAIPTTEFGCTIAVGSCTGASTQNLTEGYLVYFSEFHDCIGIAYASYTDGNQCNNGGGTAGAGTSPLASVSVPAGSINDSNWHDVDIQILDNKIYVRWDGNLMLSYSDVYNRDLTDYQAFGFGSRSGGDVDNHYVRGLLVTKLGANASQYNVDSASPLASDLYWSNSTTSLGVGTSSPNSTLEVDGTSAEEPMVSGHYSVGSACESSAITSAACSTSTTAGDLVWGTGTSWNTADVAAGDIISFSNGETAMITTVNSATELTVSSSQLIPSGSTYTINLGTACIGSTTACTAAGTLLTGTNTDFTASMVGDIINFPDGVTDTISAVSSTTSATVASAIQAGSTYTIEAGGLQVSNSTSASTANITVGANSTFGGNLDSVTQTATGTHTYTEANASYAYSFYADLTATTATTQTYNITGLPTTAGIQVHILSELTDDGALGQHLIVQIGGTQISEISGTATGTYYDDYILMYTGSAWRIDGQGPQSTSDTQNANDYAEWIDYAGDTAPQPGDVLTVGSGNTTVADSDTPYDPALLGVVSTNPYQVAGTNDGHSIIIALAGRVPISVSLANGAIEPGDPLTSSSTPGVAMLATQPGNIIGTALQAYDGTQPSNQIMVQLHVGYDVPTAGSGILLGNQTAGDLTVNGNEIVSENDTVQGTMAVAGGISSTGNSSLSSLLVGDTLNVTGNLKVGGTANISDLQAQSADISGQFSVGGNTTLASLLVGNGLTVSGNLTVNGSASLANLTVTGNTSTQNLTVNGTTTLAGDVDLSAKINMRQATIKTFTTSGPINSGEVVILDTSPGNVGDVTTTTTPDDTRVIGVAVSSATTAGDSVQVAIGGWVQVNVDTALNSNGNSPPSITPGELIVTSATPGTVQASTTPAPGTILGKSTANQDANNQVWVLITLQ